MTSIPHSTARILTTIGLVVAALAILLQIAAGVDDYPTIPPGTILLVLAAVVVVVWPRWWSTLLAVVLTGVILVGAVLTDGTGERLSNADDLYPFTWTLVQMIGLIVAFGAGLIATIQAFRSRTDTGPESTGRPGS